ncbi:ricin-type beta-trefoil lectin domain protein [Streptosporangium lutulentum]
MTHLVDMHSGFTTADLADGLHPNAVATTRCRRAGSPLCSPYPAVSLRGPRRSVPPSRCPTLSRTVAWTSRGEHHRGAQVHIWDCHGQTNQRWTRTAAGELRVYGNRCLDVNGNGTANGTKVQIWTCNGGTAQRFTFAANGGIVGAGSGKCVDVAASGTANGTPVRLWECNGTGAQRWSVR